MKEPIRKLMKLKLVLYLQYFWDASRTIPIALYYNWKKFNENAVYWHFDMDNSKTVTPEKTVTL